MDNSKMNYVNYSAPGLKQPTAAPAPAARPEAPLTWRDAAGPAAAVLLAILYWRTFALEYMGTDGPGLGVLAFTAAHFAAVWLMLGRRLDRRGLPLAGAALALALSCALSAHMGLTILNCFLILALAAMATFALSGQSRFGPFTLRAIPEAVRLSVLALFTRIDRPFRAAGRAGNNHRSALGRTLLALAATLLILAVVLALLASADMVFGSYFRGISRWLKELEPGEVLWRVIRAAALALFIASGLCFLREPAPEVRSGARAAPSRPALPFLMPVLALDLVYIIFCAVQIRYLFGGGTAAAMAGGWAEYARTGFFQLVAVAAINLILCVLSAKPDRLAARGGPLLRIGGGGMLVLTGVILASAGYRMHLYIAVYGMSVLRLMTLWGMAVILAGLLLAAWKLWKPDFAFYPAFFGVALAAWCLFSLAGPAGRAADYNVDAYLSGRLEEMDVRYLQDLGADAVPALERLAASDAPEAHVARESLDSMRRSHAREADGLPWTQWKVSYRHY